jgi:hypothetical protein
VGNDRRQAGERRKLTKDLSNGCRRLSARDECGSTRHNDP